LKPGKIAMGIVIRGLFLVGLLLGCAAQVWAEFSLTPGITLRQEYNDNIDLDAEDEEDDFITTISPRLNLNWQTKYVDLNLNANVNFKYYLDSGDTETDAGDASTLNSVFDLYRGILFLRVSDTYSRVTIDEGGRGSEDNSRVNQTDTNRLTINPYLQFVPLGDLQVMLGYSYQNLWYEEEEGDDAESHTYDLVLTKPLSERISLSLSGTHLEYRPKDVAEVVTRDEEGNYEYDHDSVRVGLSYQVSEKLQVECGYGHSWLDYDVREDSDSDTWDVSADYEISSSLTTGIAYRLDYRVSVEDGPSERDMLTTYLAYDDRIQVRLAVFVAGDKYVEIDRDSDSYGAVLGGSLPFSDKTGLTWGLRYANYDESSSELRLESINVPLPPNSIFPGDSITVIVPRVIDTSEEYDRYGARLAFYYDIRLGRLSAGYTYSRNESDLEENDYTNNIIYLQANLTF